MSNNHIAGFRKLARYYARRAEVELAQSRCGGVLLYSETPESKDWRVKAQCALLNMQLCLETEASGKKSL